MQISKPAGTFVHGKSGSIEEKRREEKRREEKRSEVKKRIEKKRKEKISGEIEAERDLWGEAGDMHRLFG